jgi:hypothetical protein
LIALLALTLLSAFPATAQDFAPHRAVYAVSPLEQGRPGGGALGTYAYELRLTCEGYVVNQRLRLELEGARKAIVSEQQSQLSESRDGRKLRFEHRSITDGKVTSHVKGEASLDDNGRGQSLFSEPEGQSVALPAGTLFPIAIARATVQRAMAGDTGFDAQFFFGEKVKPPFEVNVVIGRVPKRLADLAIPKGGESLIEGRTRIYYRGGFFDAEAKVTGEQATFEMSSLALDNGVELYGTHEEGDGGIEYRVTRLEPLPRPNCK